MAKATAICTCRKCGAKFEKYTTKATRREADSWVEWAERTFSLCPDCEREERAAQLQEKSAEAGLPELQGSVKQIVWAESLRSEYITNGENMMKVYEAKGDTKNAEIFERVRDYTLKTKTDAGWWIDRRGLFKQTVVEVYKKIKDTVK